MEPTLVLLPGLDGTGDLFAPLLAANVDVRALLDRIRVPTLYLRATEDRLVPRSAAASFKRFAPSARVVEIEGPHFLLQANPVETARVISGFVREVA